VNISDTPSDASRARNDAARWLAKLARGLDRDDGPALREWLKSPTNRQAMADSLAHWHGPDVAALLAEVMPEESKRVRHRRGRNVLITALAAIVAVTFVVSLTNAMLDGRSLWSYFDGSHLPRSVVASTHYVTGAGEKRDIAMPDGSHIVLGGDTRLTVKYSLPYRDVTLEAGEARFSVAYDPDWPFNVHAGKREFTALGSHFDMRVVTPEVVDLTVTVGSVKVQFATPRRPEASQRSENLSFGEAIVGSLHTARVYPGFQSIRRIDLRAN
jgi:transmembrane sensor